MTLNPLDNVIVRNLRKDAKRTGQNFLPPRVCQVVKVEGDALTIRLRLGAMSRWNPRTRTASIDDVARYATAREVAVGMPIGDVPGRVM